MVYIHGGGFTLGTSASTRFNGSFLASEQDVIVVTFNYRLNIFGFPGLPINSSVTKPEAQNFGLLDLRAVLVWVRSNIPSFGGDISRILLFGQSAGAAAADAYLYSTYANPAQRQDPIISAVILQSGTWEVAVNNLLLPETTLQEEARWQVLSERLGCPVRDLSCWRGVEAGKLRDAVVASNLTFQPTLDGVTLFSDMASRQRKGDFLQVPMLVGTNDGEAVRDPETSQLAFGCPAARTSMYAIRRVKGEGKVWMYRWMPRWGEWGAYHGAEVVEVFGTAGEEVEKVRKESSKVMMRAWAGFAKDPEWGLGMIRWVSWVNIKDDRGD